MPRYLHLWLSPARDRIEELRAEENDFGTAVVHAALGEVDIAFRPLRTLPKIETTVALRHFYPDLLSRFRADPRYEALIEEINQQWGLNSDGSLPDGSLPEESRATTKNR